jgi:hypothetical protein
VRHDHDSYWLWVGAAFFALAVALIGGAIPFDAASKVPYSFWTSAPMIVAYVMFGLAVACLACAARGVPFPLATGGRDGHDSVLPPAGVAPPAQLAGAPEASQRRPSQTEVPEKREMDITPEQLTGFFKGVTDLQGQDRVARYIGGWMTVSGPLRDVGSISPTDVLVHFADRSFYSYNDVRMRFREKRWADALAPKNPGDRLIVRGQIESVDSQTVHLDHCELLT